MYFNHRFGIEIKTFYRKKIILVVWDKKFYGLENNKLREFFDILTINSDKSGKTFVSAIEAKDFPFYGVQFHPEKNSL